jgi:hypothetical protein
MADLLPLIAEATGVPAPSRRIPLWLMHVLAAGYEVYARLTGRPVLHSWAMTRTVATEDDRSRYNPTKSERALGLRFRPAEQTLPDEMAWSARAASSRHSQRAAPDEAEHYEIAIPNSSYEG